MQTSRHPISSILTYICNICRKSTGRRQHRAASRVASVLLLLSAAVAALNAHALPADTYVTQSALSSGRWARISVTSPGIQFLSNSALRSMGFSDPSKVHVYGYGGNMLPETLNANLRDDLPMVGTYRADNGIYFFGTNHIGWTFNRSAGMYYQHTINPYSETSYYFLSDREADSDTPDVKDCSDIRPGNMIDSFIERRVHEQDLMAPANTGRTILGEDFRGVGSRTFSFDTPDNLGDVNIRVAFGAYTTGGASTLAISANGKDLEGTHTISAVRNKEGFLEYVTFVKSADLTDSKLNVGIAFSSAGAVNTARLDYIEVEYRRRLRMADNGLHFYTTLTGTSTFSIEGCGASTQIWDITDPVHPVRLDYRLDGTTATFTDNSTGNKEYIAFNPASVKTTPAAAGTMANQDIHGLPAPDMVIITPSQYLEASRAIAAMHERQDGMTVHVLTPEEIYNEFSSGSADVTAFRKMLKMWYDRAEGRAGEYPRYCLIMGRPTYDNKGVTPAVAQKGYPHVPVWCDSSLRFTQYASYSTDDYIGMLADTGTSFSIASAKIHVAVGRMPVKSVSEAETAARKLIKYVEQPELGSWRNNVMLIADDQDNGNHLQQAEDVWKGMRSTGNGSDFLYEKLYLDSYPLSYTSTGAGYPEAKARMLKMIDNGVSYISYIGHANPKSWTHEGLLNWTDITSMTNKRLPFLFAATCEYLRWDDDAISGAEIMWLYPDSGVIGMICPTRTVYITNNGKLNRVTAPFVYARNEDGGPTRVGDIFINGKNAYPDSSDDNKLRFALMADPAMRIVSPTLSVKVDTINGIDITAISGDLPVIGARSQAVISGRVTDAAGETQTGFNGVLEISLYDAEKAITTYGNGENGMAKNYNDRKTRLYNGRVNVAEGRWSVTILMPSEIENNFTTAMLSMYASSAEGLEANGECTDFYVYGYDSTAEDDNEGPEITDFTLNSAAFASGDMVNSTPVVFATISDESGINLSEAGIGHKMTIIVDDAVYHDDVADFYTPDAADPKKGSLKYPLAEVAPGSHTLQLTVWDNANNSATASLNFNVGIGLPPTIIDLSASASPAVTSTVLTLTTDRPMSAMNCLWEVFDFNGNLLWSENSSTTTDIDSRLSVDWNLQDNAGRRVARGLYIYRATLSTPEGYTSRASRRIAVAGAGE